LESGEAVVRRLAWSGRLVAVLVAVVHRECDPLRLVQLLRLREEHKREILQEVR